MMNKEKTLFIFEGARTEDKFVEKLELNFLGKGHAIKCVYDAEIYQLYRAIKNEGDLFLDIVTLLKERSNENAKILEEYRRDSFAYVYLFFDYDAHSTLADDKKITEMLSFLMMRPRMVCCISVIQWLKQSDTIRIWKVSGH